MITHPPLVVKLDTINSENAETVRNWRNSPEILKWSRQTDLLNRSQHSEWMDSHPKNKTIRMYMIRALDDTLLGVCGLSDIDLINQRAEFSLYIAPEHQGKGYGSDALKLLCKNAFDSMPIRQIWGECFSGNPAIKTFLKVGFSIDGTRKCFYFREGKFIDSMLISLKRDEFKI